MYSKEQLLIIDLKLTPGQKCDNTSKSFRSQYIAVFTYTELKDRIYEKKNHLGIKMMNKNAHA